MPPMPRALQQQAQCWLSKQATIDVVDESQPVERVVPDHEHHVGVPIKWADGVLDLARDLFATHLLASASFAPRWGGSPDGETFVVRECWTWSAHSRSVVEGTLVCAVVYGGASLK